MAKKPIQLSLQWCPKPEPERIPGPDPQVGMGATQYLNTDLQAWTVIEVLGSNKIRVQRDRVAGQVITQDPTGRVLTITRRNRGIWSPPGSGKGESFLLGHRVEHLDRNR
jgi:hypothetical protein